MQAGTCSRPASTWRLRSESGGLQAGSLGQGLFARKHPAWARQVKGDQGSFQIAHGVKKARMFSSFSKASLAPSKPHKGRLIMRRQFSWSAKEATSSFTAYLPTTWCMCLRVIIVMLLSRNSWRNIPRFSRSQVAVSCRHFWVYKSSNRLARYVYTLPIRLHLDNYIRAILGNPGWVQGVLGEISPPEASPDPTWVHSWKGWLPNRSWSQEAEVISIICS